MSRIAALAGMGAASALFLVPGMAAAQEPGEPLFAEQAIETARALYSVPEQTVSVCPDDTGEEAEDGAAGDVIIVCRRLGGPYEFQTRAGPRADTSRTAGGAPRPPDVSTIPPCGSVPGGFGVASCTRFGSAPPPALMIDVTRFPEPLSPEDAARVFRIEEEASPLPVTSGGR